MARQARGWKLNCNMSVYDEICFSMEGNPQRILPLTQDQDDLRHSHDLTSAVGPDQRCNYWPVYVRLSMQENVSYIITISSIRPRFHTLDSFERGTNPPELWTCPFSPSEACGLYPWGPFTSTVRSESLSRGPQGGRERAEHVGRPWQWGQHCPVERGYGCTCAIKARVLVVWFCQCSLTNWPCGSFLRLLSMYGKARTPNKPPSCPNRSCLLHRAGKIESLTQAWHGNNHTSCNMWEYNTELSIR